MVRKTVVAGCVALGLALAACGQTTPGQASAVFDNAQRLAVAAQSETASTKSAKFDFEMNMMGLKMTGNGAGSFDKANPVMAMTMNMLGQQIEMRMVNRTMYMKMPGGIPGADPAKPWIKVSEVPGMQGPDQMAQQNDPRKMLEMLQKAGSITKSEPAELNGKQTTHYWINLDLAKMADQAPGGMSADDLAKVRRAGVSNLPMQLWVDENNLPVRIYLDMSNMIKTLASKSGQSLPGEPKMSMTLNYHDWGGKVDVQPPPANQVGEMQDLPGADLGGASGGGMPSFGGIPN